MNRKTMSQIGGAAAITLCFGVALAAPAQAKTVAPSATGTCSGSSTVKIHTSEHKKGIKVRAQIKTGTPGELWVWTLTDNGTTVNTDETSTGHNGKLVVRETIPNLDGTDTIDFTAVDSVTGETCTVETMVG